MFPVSSFLIDIGAKVILERYENLNGRLLNRYQNMNGHKIKNSVRTRCKNSIHMRRRKLACLIISANMYL